MPVNPDTPDAAVPGMDANAARRWLALPRHDSPWLHEEVAGRMVQRLEWFREQPASWLHWDPVMGGLQGHARLRERLPQADWYVWTNRPSAALNALAEDAARSWNPLRWRGARTVPELPQGATVGMVWANMSLHTAAQPQALMAHWHALLKTHGFVMFSCLGPDTLRELRALYLRAGWPEPAHAFTDMHDWGDMLVHGGFAEPVMDMERITLSYSSASAVLEELRGLGRNLSLNRHPALRGRAWRERLLKAIEEGLPRDEQGRLLLGFEIIYGHAYKPVPRVPVKASQAVSVDEMRAMLRAGRG